MVGCVLNMPVLVEPPTDTPQIDNVIRSLLGDNYPDNVFVLYMPQRVCHVFVAVDPDDDPQANIFHWVACFTQQEHAVQWVVSMVPVPRIGRFARPEWIEIHSHPLPEACDLVKNLYPQFRGLLVMHADGRRIRHFVR
jgi:hypothetical protein